MRYHLAQINVARLIAPIDHPLIADFVAQLDEINALAERSPGFVWRLKDETGNATHIDAFGDPMLIVNMSVWKDVASLKHFTYHSDHLRVLRDRARWFEKSREAHLALWWVPIHHRPDPYEGKERIEHLRQNGESAFAFTFRNVYTPPYAW